MAAVSGSVLCCSQSRSVPSAKPYFVAKSTCDRPSLNRMARASETGLSFASSALVRGSASSSISMDGVGLRLALATVDRRFILISFPRGDDPHCIVTFDVDHEQQPLFAGADNDDAIFAIAGPAEVATA